MIRHIVVWRLKDEAEGKSKKENARIIKESLEALKGIVPEIRSISVGINEDGAPADNYDIVLNSTFDTLEDLAAYQSNSDHKKAGSYIVKVASERACVDYEE